MTHAVASPPTEALSLRLPLDGRVRVVIEGVKPEVDGGRFAAKRVSGDIFAVEADIFCDSAEELGASLLLFGPDGSCTEHLFNRLDNDRWRVEVPLGPPGRYAYTIEGWIRRYASWLTVVERRPRGHKDLRAEFDHAAALLESAAERASGEDRTRLGKAAERFRGEIDDELYSLAREGAEIADRYESREHRSRYDREIPLVVDPALAGFSAWYEFFPRSTTSTLR